MMTSSNGDISMLLALCAGNSPVTGEFPPQRPVTWSFESFLWSLNKRLSKQTWGWWFEVPSCSLWRHCNENVHWDYITRSGSLWLCDVTTESLQIPIWCDKSMVHDGLSNMIRTKSIIMLFWLADHTSQLTCFNPCEWQPYWSRFEAEWCNMET